jgi:hypothetical protein
MLERSSAEQDIEVFLYLTTKTKQAPYENDFSIHACSNRCIGNLGVV